MNRNQIGFYSFHIMLLIIILLGHDLSAAEKDNGCWADFFEDAQYAGKHFQLTGTTQLENLNNVNGANWDSRIGSLKVGANATVTVFDNVDFKLTATDMAKSPDLMRSWGVTAKDVKEQSELIFHPNSMIHDLSDFHFHNKVRSLKIKCN